MPTESTSGSPATPPPAAAPMKWGFAGTPDFAARIVIGLMQAGLRPSVIYTQPDRPRGRGKRLLTGPVKDLAIRESIAYQQPKSLRSPETVETLASYDLDVLLVAAYGLILPLSVLETPRFGCVNVHASALPRWRGAAPIERAIMAGDTETAVCLMQMDEGLDTGPVLSRRSIAIEDQTTGAVLERQLADIGVELLLELLPKLAFATPEPQTDSGASYATKLKADDSRIDWSLSAKTIVRQIHALADRAPAFTELNGERIRILDAVVAPMDQGIPADSPLPDHPGMVVTDIRTNVRVSCGEGTYLIITRLALSRGKGTPLDIPSLRNGYPELLRPGQSLDAITGQDAIDRIRR